MAAMVLTLMLVLLFLCDSTMTTKIPPQQLPQQAPPHPALITEPPP
jgi:hypothetical protein